MRPLSRLFACLLAITLPAGCGTRASTGDRPASATPDTVRVRAAKDVTIVIPAPPGMVDMMTVARRPPMPDDEGRVVWGMFQPREQVARIARGGEGSDTLVFASLERSPANAIDFSSRARRWAEMGRARRTRAALRLAETLVQYESGALDRDPELGTLPDTLAVDFEIVEPTVRRMVILAPGPQGTTDVSTDSRVLVRGRVLRLMWVHRRARTIGDLAQVCDDSKRWARAILGANP